MSALLWADDGTTIHLDTHRWHREADHVELTLLASLPDPLLDIGCGPGRVGAALASVGRVVLGIDTAPRAVAEAERRGGPVLHRSVFAPLPGEGRWCAAVLLDGNIGIGGDPAALLQRVRALLAPHGQVVVEVGPPGTPNGGLQVRLSDGGVTGPWFPWARVSADRFPSLAHHAGMATTGFDEADGRWFARAVRP